MLGMMMEPKKMAKVIIGGGGERSPMSGMGPMMEKEEIDTDYEDPCMGIAEELIAGVKEGSVEKVAECLKSLKYVMQGGEENEIEINV